MLQDSAASSWQLQHPLRAQRQTLLTFVLQFWASTGKNCASGYITVAWKVNQMLKVAKRAWMVCRKTQPYGIIVNVES